jgi:hypothetical protein
MTTYKLANETEVYVSEKGYVCLKQEPMHMEEQLIILSPEQAEMLLCDLAELIKEAKEIW